MLFNSYHFLFFFPIVVLGYYVIPKRMRTLWLLIASYYFYMSWNPKYVVIIVLCTVVTWFGGILLATADETERGKRYRKLILFGCCVVTLGVLVFFKYFSFLWESIGSLAGYCGVRITELPFSLVLPVGISFYTFQALSYTIDVYRRKIPVQKNLIEYALFVSFFPQLVAGPIERSENLLSQIQGVGKIEVRWREIRNGLVYMLYGFFLKMVLADNLAVFVDNIFKRYFFYGSVELILAAIGFAFQIYCDFSSYSAIAIGAAQVMGFRLMENFHAPYFASSVQDFWRRWHISLSSWFKDYLYIPLGGNRCSKLRYYCNLMITFLVSGLWHGANWTFVVWGGIHGAYQIVGQILRPVKRKVYPLLGINLNGTCYRIAQIVCTFFLTTFAWIFFRADSIKNAYLYIVSIFTKWDFWVLTDGSLKNIGFYNGVEWVVVIVGLLVLLFADVILYRRNLRIDEFLAKQGTFFVMAAVFLFITSIAVFGNYGGYEANAFIYFQF